MILSANLQQRMC